MATHSRFEALGKSDSLGSIPPNGTRPSARRRAGSCGDSSKASRYIFNTTGRDMDKYGRTLAYVHLPNGVFVNEMLIQHGYGRLIKRFPFRYRDRFQRYEREAQQAGRGLWGIGAGERRPSRTHPASVLGRYDDNGNGRITCAEARRHGIAPVRRGHPAYPYMHDANNDGIVCR